MKTRTLLIGFGGNLLIALVGLLLTFHSFNRVFGVILYFGKHDNHFPDGIEAWIMPALLDGRNALLQLLGVFLVLLLFNSLFAAWILWSKRKGDHSA
jgi:hypothetical protein